MVEVVAVLECFGLSPPLVAPVPVAGGLSNELWRVQTREGVFAVKRMVVNADRPGFVASVEASFAVERRAFAAGVPMPEPVPAPSTGCALAAVGGSLFRVHRWVAGRAGAGSAREAVELLARIHAAGGPRRAPPPCPAWTPASRWGPLVAGLAERVAGQPERLLVVDSHGDLDRKNTLLGDVLVALDWDAAGPVSAVQEAVSVALDWSRGDPAVFAEAVTAYRSLSGVAVPAEPWVFGWWVAAQGGWLDYTAEHDPGEAQRTLDRLRRLATDLDAFTSPPAGGGRSGRRRQ